MIVRIDEELAVDSRYIVAIVKGSKTKIYVQSGQKYAPYCFETDRSYETVVQSLKEI